MKILVTPMDMIERCLWSNYKRFVLKENSDAKLKELIEANELVLLTENDAYVIGLLKYVQTDNFVHRCKMELEDTLKIKSTIVRVKDTEKVLINKPTIIRDIMEFKNRFPDNYITDPVYKKSIEELFAFVTSLMNSVNELEEYHLTVKDKDMVYLQSSDISKFIKI